MFSKIHVRISENSFGGFLSLVSLLHLFIAIGGARLIEKVRVALYPKQVPGKVLRAGINQDFSCVQT